MCLKGCCRENEKTPQRMRESFVSHPSDKGPGCRIHKELSKCNNIKTHTPSKKWTQNLNRPFSKEDTQIANEQIKRYSIFLAIRKMYLKPQ